MLNAEWQATGQQSDGWEATDLDLVGGERGAKEEGPMAGVGAGTGFVGRHLGRHHCAAAV